MIPYFISSYPMIHTLEPVSTFVLLQTRRKLNSHTIQFIYIYLLIIWHKYIFLYICNINKNNIFYNNIAYHVQTITFCYIWLRLSFGSNFRIARKNNFLIVFSDIQFFRCVVTLAKFQSVRGASHYLILMDNCLTFS